MQTSSDRLWTPNFFIILFGSMVALLGSALAGFGIGVMALDATQSTFLYTLVLVANKAPKMIMPLLAGPWLDAFSRKKAMRLMHFLSAGIYLGMYLLLKMDLYNYWLFVLLTFVAGMVNGVYLVAHESLYPTLISRGNYRRAYAVSSVLDTLQTVAAPLALSMHEQLGWVGPIFAIGAAAFGVAGLAVSFIRIEEAHLKGLAQKFSLRRYRQDFSEGLDYIKSEPGLVALSLYFFFNVLCMGVDSLAMPYFKNTPSLGAGAYNGVMLGMMLGRMLGSMVQFVFRYPPDKKYRIAMGVYISVALIQGGYLLLPGAGWMAVAMFFMGALAGISFNIRVVSTQAYIPNTHRARFNGTFIMLTNMGMVIGQLMAGALAELVPIRGIYLGALAAQMAAIYLTIGRKSKHVRVIYNSDL